jgi:hypothetical protein
LQASLSSTATNLRVIQIKDSGHFIPEEQRVSPTST